MTLVSIKNNQVWLNSVKTVEDIYFVTKGFPPGDEKMMRRQMRKDSVSITLNVAEAFLNIDGRKFSGSMQAALRSCSSLLKCLIISRSYGWICPEEFMALINRIDRQVGMIYKNYYRYKKINDLSRIDRDFRRII